MMLIIIIMISTMIITLIAELQLLWLIEEVAREIIMLARRLAALSAGLQYSVCLNLTLPKKATATLILDAATKALSLRQKAVATSFSRGKV